MFYEEIDTNVSTSAKQSNNVDEEASDDYLSDMNSDKDEDSDEDTNESSAKDVCSCDGSKFKFLHSSTIPEIYRKEYRKLVNTSNTHNDKK